MCTRAKLIPKKLFTKTTSTFSVAKLNLPKYFDSMILSFLLYTLPILVPN